MIGIDTNLLLHSLNPGSARHEAAVQFLRQHFGVPSIRVALTDYVLVELYVHLRNPVVMAKPLSPAAAKNLVTSYLKIPNVMRIENAPVMDQVWSLAGTRDFARRRIFDARLALTLRHAGMTQFATPNVKDFQCWGFERVWNPLVGE
jgi:predicted nucleic acid-binding protein